MNRYPLRNSLHLIRLRVQRRLLHEVFHTIPLLLFTGLSKVATTPASKFRSLAPSQTGSQSIAESTKDLVREGSGGVCVLCGEESPEVCHIIARTPDADYQLQWLINRHLKPNDFIKSDITNLICRMSQTSPLNEVPD